MGKKVAIWVDEVLHQTGKALRCRIGNDDAVWFPNVTIGDVWKDETLFPEGPLDEDLIHETDVCMTVEEHYVEEKCVPETHILDNPAYGG
jgi:hypothetical protein